MAKRKFDYDGDEFYDEIFAMAMNGATDSEIAIGLADKFGKGLTPDVFGSMKNGTYAYWSKKENEKYQKLQNLENQENKSNSIKINTPQISKKDTSVSKQIIRLFQIIIVCSFISYFCFIYAYFSIFICIFF